MPIRERTLTSPKNALFREVLEESRKERVFVASPVKGEEGLPLKKMRGGRKKRTSSSG